MNLVFNIYCKNEIIRKKWLNITKQWLKIYIISENPIEVKRKKKWKFNQIEAMEVASNIYKVQWQNFTRTKYIRFHLYLEKLDIERFFFIYSTFNGHHFHIYSSD